MQTIHMISHSLALFFDICADTELLVQILEIAAKEIGLYINNKKTEFIFLNHKDIVKSLNGNTLKEVENFRYCYKINFNEIS